MSTSAKLLTRISIIAVFVLAVGETRLSAATWNGIEPLKTRRDEVVKKLGEPLNETTQGVMSFNVMGGSVKVRFVDEQFVKAKRLKADLVGTVLEIILQHEHSSDTPESLKLAENRQFMKDESKETTIFRNLKEGLIYTFIGGSLRTTRYTFGDDQLTKARR